MKRQTFLKSRGAIRSASGVITSLSLVAVLALTFAIGCFGIDVARGFLVHHELQTATECGALAGAGQLITFLPPPRETLEKAANMALEVTALNTADGVPILSDGVDCWVDASTNGPARKVTVTATRQMHTYFAKYVGIPTFSIVTHATAGARPGLLAVSPKQLVPIIVSVDAAPQEGPQKGKAFDTFPPGMPFIIDLGTNDKQRNAQVIDNWKNLNPDSVVIGKTDANLTLAPLQTVLAPGETIVVSLMSNSGGPPFSSPQKIIGVVGFRITSVKLPKIYGMLRTPIRLIVKPGIPPIIGEPTITHFLFDNLPWKVMLYDE